MLLNRLQCAVRHIFTHVVKGRQVQHPHQLHCREEQPRESCQSDIEGKRPPASTCMVGEQKGHFNYSFALLLLQVENDLRDVNLTVYIRVPIKLGEKNIWTNKNLQVVMLNKVVLLLIWLHLWGLCELFFDNYKC